MSKTKTENELNNHLADAAKQSGIVFIGKVLGYFLGFLFNVVLAREYGAEILGEYTLIRTTVNLIIIFTVFGLDNGLLKYIPRYKSKDQKGKLNFIIKIAFLYGSFLSIIGMILLFLLKDFISRNFFNDPNLIELFNHGALLIIPFTLIRLLKGLYRGFKHLKDYIVAFEIFRRILFVLALMLFSYLGFQSTSIVLIIILVGQFLTVSYLIYRTSSLKIDFKEIIFENYIKNEKVNKEVKSELLTYSSTLILISFTNLMLNRVDRLMLGIFSTSKMVGIYNIGATIGRIVVFFLISSNMIFSSIISEVYSKGKIEMLEKLYSIITRWLIILTLPLVINMIVFSRTIMNFFGNEYLVGTSTLIVIVLGNLINTFVGATGYILNMSGYERLVLLDNILLVVINIILNILFIPRYGITGAAIATAISIAVVNIIRISQIKAKLDILPYNREYSYLLINLVTIIFFSYLAKIYLNGVITVVITTVITTIISILISYKSSGEVEINLFNQVFKKIKFMIGFRED